MTSSFVSICIRRVAMSAFGPIVESKAIVEAAFELRLLFIRMEGLLTDSLIGGVAALQVSAKYSGKAFLSSLKRSDPDFCIFASRSSVTTYICVRDVATTTALGSWESRSSPALSRIRWWTPKTQPLPSSRKLSSVSSSLCIMQQLPDLMKASPMACSSAPSSTSRGCIACANSSTSAAPSAADSSLCEPFRKFCSSYFISCTRLASASWNSGTPTRSSSKSERSRTRASSFVTHTTCAAVGRSG
mmetsp:Transcript_5261/g.12888  ORF Transcript_5261/g.12888 Transcript_5261/m.12888 type:complete len:245 (+) Transcript_5261:750-1484(+)